MIGAGAYRSSFPLARMHATHEITKQADAVALVRPLGIFVARRDSFECVAPRDMGVPQLTRWLFDSLPLREHGWCAQRATVSLVCDGYQERTWRMERG